MKTLLAIALTVAFAAATLTFGAPVTPISGTAVAGGPLPSTYCGQNFCPPKQSPAGPSRPR
jgi:hypothetical protein